MRNIIILFAVFCMSTALFAQEQKFLKMPKFNKDDLKKEKSEIEPKAPAEILYRSIHFRIDNNTGNLIKEYTYRVKIYDKDKSEDWHNLEVSLYDNNSGDREVLLNMNALVYNLEGDNVVESKVDKSSKFRSKENKYRTVNKYAFPAIKNGSILEYHYEVSSPFGYEIPLIYIELDIPSVYTEYVLDSPIQVSYNVDFTGSLVPKYQTVKEEIMYGSQYKTYRFAYNNLKSFKTEKFVKNNDNYRTKIRAELHSTYIGNNLKVYTSTWEDIRKKLWDHEDFGSQYKKDRLVKDLLPAAILDEKNNLTRANKILEFVKTNFTWNQNNGIYAENGVRDLIKNKTGNDSDLNLMLTAMFRSANITAYPILISTVRNGSVNLTFPNLGNFNYVIVGAEINKVFYLFDATSKQSQANLLPSRVWNDNGLLMKDDKAEIISLTNIYIGHNSHTVKAKINPDGTVSGAYQDQDEGMFAMNAKENFDENPDKYKKQYKENFSVDFGSVNSRVINEEEFRSTMAFTSNNMIDVIGKKMILNPLLFLQQTKNDFDQQDERKYRIDFISPMSKTKIVEIEIPEGYDVAELPKNKKIVTEDKEISYSYTIEKKDNKILTVSEYNIASGNYPKEYYPAFKQIWKVISDCESQVMSLIKK
ncbi:transglutaminase domain-containing protein [Chryseobacterium sp. RR2-3-20]|uniref:transglutaminase domain-containing protein n=1 Tax=Chryseobacterium sp. RR2-3-20 TaxID=2787626 RepID=UPI001ADECB06|nr:transglutaminase domain-containing protein [Chryseobacterium sp. RR2-3-20]